MLKKLFVTYIFFAELGVWAMNDEKNDFSRVVFNNPIRNLSKETGALTEGKIIRDTFVKPHIQSENGRDGVSRSFSGEDSFNRVVFDNPTGDLSKEIEALTGKARVLGDAFIKLYVQPEDNRGNIFKNFSTSDIRRLYSAADFVARCYYAKMQKSSLFDVDQAKQAVRWLEVVDRDEKLACYGSDIYRDGEKISDLLRVAKDQYEKRKSFLEKNDKLEEELMSLLTFESEKKEKK